MPRLRLSAIPVLLAAATVALAGCSGSGGTTTATTPAAGPSASPAGRGSPNRAPGGMQRLPGTSGTVAEVGKDRIEVQNPSFGQVTVTFSASTRFSQTVTASPSSVAAGDCVQAIAAGRRPTGRDGAGSGSGSGGAGAPADGPFTATAVTIVGTANASGTCMANGGFDRGGARPTAGPRMRTPRPRPTGTGRPGSPGGAGGDGRFGGLAVGRVVSVSGNSFVVAREARGGATPGTQTVRTTSTTTVTRMEPTTAKALAVGTCATALGKADDTGTVAATSISLRQAGPQGCVPAGRFRRGMGGGNG